MCLTSCSLTNAQNIKGWISLEHLSIISLFTEYNYNKPLKPSTMEADVNSKLLINPLLDGAHIPVQPPVHLKYHIFLFIL